MILYKFGFHALFPGGSPADSREFHFYPPINQPPVPTCRKEHCSLGSVGPCWEEEEQVPRPWEAQAQCEDKNPGLTCQSRMGLKVRRCVRLNWNPFPQWQASEHIFYITNVYFFFCLCSVWWHQDLTHLEGLWVSFLFCFIYLLRGRQVEKKWSCVLGDWSVSLRSPADTPVMCPCTGAGLDEILYVCFLSSSQSQSSFPYANLHIRVFAYIWPPPLPTCRN